MPSDAGATLAALAITAWLSLAALWDLRHRVVPNLLTLPLMAAGAAWQVLGLFPNIQENLHRLGFLVAWAAIYMLWERNFMGGGDAKLYMALFALWGLDQRLLLTLAVTSLLCALPLLVWKYRHTWRQVPASLAARVMTMNLLPEAEELQGKGQPLAWVIALGGIAYAWMRALGVLG